jgi:hypothetical protein
MIHPSRTLSEPVQVVKNFGLETGGQNKERRKEFGNKVSMKIEKND